MVRKKRAVVPKVVAADRHIERLYAKVKADLVASRRTVEDLLIANLSARVRIADLTSQLALAKARTKGCH